MLSKIESTGAHGLADNMGKDIQFVVGLAASGRAYVKNYWGRVDNHDHLGFILTRGEAGVDGPLLWIPVVGKPDVTLRRYKDSRNRDRFVEGYYQYIGKVHMRTAQPTTDSQILGATGQLLNGTVEQAYKASGNMSKLVIMVRKY